MHAVLEIEATTTAETPVIDRTAIRRKLSREAELLTRFNSVSSAEAWDHDDEGDSRHFITVKLAAQPFDSINDVIDAEMVEIGMELQDRYSCDTGLVRQYVLTI